MSTTTAGTAPTPGRRPSPSGETLHLDLHNATARDAGIVFEEEAWVAGTAVPVPAGGRAGGYHTVSAGMRVLCFPRATSPDDPITGAELQVAG